MGVVRVSSFPMIENNIVDEPRNRICLLKVKKTKLIRLSLLLHESGVWEKCGVICNSKDLQ
jgi:hypothetical protein